MAHISRGELKFKAKRRKSTRSGLFRSFSRLLDDFGLLACELIRRLKLIRMGLFRIPIHPPLPLRRRGGEGTGEWLLITNHQSPLTKGVGGCPITKLRFPLYEMVSQLLPPCNSTHGHKSLTHAVECAVLVRAPDLARSIRQSKRARLPVLQG
jgi:hypothetical protein